MPIALAVNAVNAALTAIVLQRLADVILPFGWLCAVVLVTAGRLVLWLRYRRARPSEKDDPHWPLLATGGSLLAGLCWELGGPLLFPILPALGQMFLTVVIGGMCTGAVVTVSAPADRSCLPALGEFASRDPVFLPSHADRQCIGGDDPGLCSSAHARCNTLSTVS